MPPHTRLVTYLLWHTLPSAHAYRSPIFLIYILFTSPGTVLGHSTVSLAAEFSPRKRGLCSQTWTARLCDLTDSTREPITIQIELRGVASALRHGGGAVVSETSSGTVFLTRA